MPYPDLTEDRPPVEERHGGEYLTDGVAHNLVRASCRNCGHVYRAKPGRQHARTCPACSFPVRLSQDLHAYALPTPSSYLRT
jgi:uncharacterized OB-fold protein